MSNVGTVGLSSLIAIKTSGDKRKQINIMREEENVSCIREKRKKSHVLKRSKKKITRDEKFFI